MVHKAKSLSSELTDEQVKFGSFTTRFISFEAAIQLFRKEYNLMDLKEKPIGYRVTDQGIEIIQS
jgi:hypothetical protein